MVSEAVGVATSWGATGASTGTAFQSGSLGKTSGSFSSGESVAIGRSLLPGAGASQRQSSQQSQSPAEGQDPATGRSHAAFIPGTNVHRNKRSRAMNARDFINDAKPVSPLGDCRSLLIPTEFPEVITILNRKDQSTRRFGLSGHFAPVMVHFA
jgi:hypothetical protein